MSSQRRLDDPEAIVGKTFRWSLRADDREMLDELRAVWAETTQQPLVFTGEGFQFEHKGAVFNVKFDADAPETVFVELITQHFDRLMEIVHEHYAEI